MKRSIFKKRLRHRVIVTVKTGDAFRGVFMEEDEQALVLVNASQIDPHSEAKYIAADGEIVILVADVAYLQFE